MSYPNRHLLHVVSRSALPLVVVTCCTVAVSREGTGFWDTPPCEESQVVSAPAEEITEVARRIQAKEVVAGDLATGRLTLVDAAARFRDLDEQPPRRNPEELGGARPGMTDDERHCRDVIAFLRQMLLTPEDPDSPVITRLEQELQDHLGRGNLRLPQAGG